MGSNIQSKNMRVPVGAVAVGERDREDLGDIEALGASITAVGLLHPVVVTEALALVAGGRRLAAVKALGWTEVPVTVVDLTSVADVLRAEADENTERKELTAHEASKARERRARVLAEDAAKHKGGRPTKEETSANLAEVSEAEAEAPGQKPHEPDRKPAERETRKAAAVGTGYSGSTLDKVDKMRDIAERGVVTVNHGTTRKEVVAPEPVREVAKRELETLKRPGAAVEPAHRAVAKAIEQHLPPDPDELHRMWRRNFLAALGAARKPLQFAAQDTADRADSECIDELRRFVDDVTAYQARVRSIIADSTPDNVRPLRSA